MNRFVQSLLIVLCLMLGNTHAGIKCLLDPDETPAAGTTMVWTPLGQAAWDKLKKVNGEYGQVIPRNDLIEKLMKFQWDEAKVMPADEYAVYAGEVTDDFLRTAREEVKRKFDMDLQLSNLSSGTGTVVIGVMKLELNYQKDFESLIAEKFKDGRGVEREVNYWGISGKSSGDYREMVDVLGYGEGGKHFTISIKTKTADQRIIIYKPEKVVSLAKSFEHVLAAKKSWAKGKADGMSALDTKLHAYDMLFVPRVNLKLSADLRDELSGSIYYKGKKAPKTITEARQMIEFELDETGGKARAKVYFGDGWGADDKPKPVARRLVCDRPFYVYMWKGEAKLPYLAVLVDGGEVFKVPKSRANGKVRLIEGIPAIEIDNELEPSLDFEER